jgi:hypothetical protein
VNFEQGLYLLAQIPVAGTSNVQEPGAVLKRKLYGLGENGHFPARFVIHAISYLGCTLYGHNNENSWQKGEEVLKLN